MSDESGDSGGGMSKPKMILFVIVLVGVFLALKFLVGIAMTILKWVIIGTLAFGITWFIFFRKKDEGGS